MAQAGLGHIYGTPFGVRGDRDKAEYWLQKAIDQGTEAPLNQIKVWAKNSDDGQ